MVFLEVLTVMDAPQCGWWQRQSPGRAFPSSPALLAPVLIEGSSVWWMLWRTLFFMAGLKALVSCRLFKYLSGSYVAVRFVLAKWRERRRLVLELSFGAF